MYFKAGRFPVALQVLLDISSPLFFVVALALVSSEVKKCSAGCTLCKENQDGNHTLGRLSNPSEGFRGTGDPKGVADAVLVQWSSKVCIAHAMLDSLLQMLPNAVGGMWLLLPFPPPISVVVAVFCPFPIPLFVCAPACRVPLILSCSYLHLLPCTEKPAWLHVVHVY
jgi:hypothetical protein